MFSRTGSQDDLQSRCRDRSNIANDDFSRHYAVASRVRPRLIQNGITREVAGLPRLSRVSSAKNQPRLYRPFSLCDVGISAVRAATRIRKPHPAGLVCGPRSARLRRQILDLSHVLGAIRKANFHGCFLFHGSHHMGEACKYHRHFGREMGAPRNVGAFNRP